MRVILIPTRSHPFPFRTRQLSLSGSMVLAPNSALREQIGVALIKTSFLFCKTPCFVVVRLLEYLGATAPLRTVYFATSRLEARGLSSKDTLWRVPPAYLPRSRLELELWKISLKVPQGMFVCAFIYFCFPALAGFFGKWTYTSLGLKTHVKM